MGPEASPLPSVGFLLPFYISGPRIKAVAFGKEGEEAEDRKQRGLCGAEVGFGHGWSAQPPHLDAVPSPPPGARQLPRQTIGPQSTPGLYQSPGVAGLQDSKTEGTHRGLCPNPSTAHQPEGRSLCLLVSK